jgi:hypothetical protein
VSVRYLPGVPGRGEATDAVGTPPAGLPARRTHARQLERAWLGPLTPRDGAT